MVRAAGTTHAVVDQVIINIIIAEEAATISSTAPITTRVVIIASQAMEGTMTTVD